MARTRVIIDLSPSSIEVVLARGPVVIGARTLAGLSPAPGRPWADAVGASSGALAGAVRELGAIGSPAWVVGASPDTVAGVFSCPVAAGRSGVWRAARLALIEASSQPDSAPHAGVLLAVDRRAVNGDSSRGSARQAHVLAAADSADAVECLWSWMGGAGLSPRGVIPESAVALASACRAALGPRGRQSGRGVACLVMHVGERQTVLAAACAGRLRFVRQVALGLADLAAAFRRAGEADGAGGDEGASTEAMELLRSVGIPQRGDTGLDVRGLSAGDVLPGLQPVLQRLAGEVRQSVRFGLVDGERDGVTLTLVGPGARVPRLAEVIATDTGVRPGATAGADATDRRTQLAALDPPLALVPAGERAARERRGVRRGVLVGVALAWLLVAADGVLTHLDARAGRRDLLALRTRRDGAARLESLDAQASAAVGAVVGARERRRAALGQQVPWDALLVEIARRLPPDVRLDGVELGYDVERAVARVRCSAAEIAPGSAGRSMKAYADALGRLPLAAQVRLGSSQRIVGVDGPAVVVFDLAIDLIGLPADAVDSLADASTPGAGGTP
ncbi:MAG: hypothetical protein ACKVU4_11625 [Phycisphaerales bacterium]